MSKLSFLTIITFFFGALIINAQELNFATFLIPKELKEDANSVIRIDNTVIEMTSQSNMTIETEMAVTVLNKLGDRFADLSIYYDKNNSLKSVKGYVYDAFGKEIEKIRKSDFEDYSASSGSLYSDDRYIHYDYTPIAYPYTVYYRYEVESSNTAFIPSWYAVSDYYQSVQSSSYSFNCPLDVKLNKSERNFNEFNIQTNHGSNNLYYKVENVKSIESEPYAPPFIDVAPNARIGVNKFNLEGVDGEAENWKEFGKWRYDNLNNGNGTINGLARVQIRKLVGGVKDPIEKAKIVYEYVQDKVRYISVQEGIGGWKPITANEVHRTSYGDCKGLSNYTKTLLDVVGVESHYTVLWAGNRKKDVNKEVFSMQGNHVILNIPNGDEDIWLECTSQDVPFGEIAGFTDDRDVLVIKPYGGEIKRTRVYADKENLQAITGSFIIDNNGHLEAKVEIQSKGNQFDTHLRYVNSNEKEIDKMYKEFWDNINNITLKNATLRNNKKESVFEEAVSFSATNYGAISGDRMIIPLNAFNVWQSTPKRIRDRKLPVEVNRGFYDADEVILKLPSDYNIEALANNVEVETPYGKYEMTIVKVDDTTLKYTRKLLFNTGKYPKEEYDAFRNFWRKVVKSDKSKIVLIKK